MAEQFKWDPKKSQVFDSSYESQESLCTSAVSFSKENGTSFLIRAFPFQVGSYPHELK